MVTGGGTYSVGSRVNISASAKSSYAFDKWSDGNTSTTCTINACKNESLVAPFKVTDSTDNGDGGGEEDRPAYI